MLKNFPLNDMLRHVFTGSGDCAKVDWTFLGFSMPEWSLLCFAALLVWALWAALGRVRS
jgi:disulfide bond formation protein DsbB